MTRRSRFHTNRYRPQTEKKLRILRKYIGPWLDIWASQGWSDEWFVLDLFAGSGESHGRAGTIAGSPLVFLEEIEARRQKLEGSRRIQLLFFEKDQEFVADLKIRVCDFVRKHELQDLVSTHIFEGDCNRSLPTVLDSLASTAGAPALVFIDPYNIDVARATVEKVLDMPWRVDALVNYMLYQAKRDVGLAASGKRGSADAVARLRLFYGDDHVPTSQQDAEDPEWYARPILCSRGHKVVVFRMEYPEREGDQYYLMFASKNDTVSKKIVPQIFAKERTDRYGQTTFLHPEDFLDEMKVIE